MKNLSLIIIFMAILWSPIAAMVATHNKDEVSENRNKVVWPSIKSSTLPELPQKITAYINDNFGLRSQFITTNSYIRFKFFKLYNSKKAIIGQNNWLYYREHQLDDFMGKKPFSTSDLKLWKNSLETKKSLLNKQGIQYLFVVAPNKVSIYPEFLPVGFRKKAHTTRLDQLVDYMTVNSQFEILDLRGKLLSEKKRHLVYHPNNTHWNDRGGFIAYLAIMQKLQGWFPSLTPMDYNEITKKNVVCGGDIIPLLGLGHKLSRQFHYESEVFESINRASSFHPNLPINYPWPKWDKWTKPEAFRSSGSNFKLLVFHDSFINNGVKWYLKGDFDYSLFIHIAPDIKLLEKIISTEKPDIVIEERVERNLFIIPKQEDIYQNNIE